MPTFFDQTKIAYWQSIDRQNLRLASENSPKRSKLSALDQLISFRRVRQNRRRSSPQYMHDRFRELILHPADQLVQPCLAASESFAIEVCQIRGARPQPRTRGQESTSRGTCNLPISFRLAKADLTSVSVQAAFLVRPRFDRRDRSPCRPVPAWPIVLRRHCPLQTRRP